MPNYLWLGMYDARPERHSSCLVLTYEADETAFGNLYRRRLQLAGLPPHCTAQEVRSVQLVDDETDSPLFAARLLLGIIPDRVRAALLNYTREAADILNDGAAGEDWVLMIVRSFEDSRFLPAGTTSRALDALDPRR
ncbi:hypothetical protein AURDEDRAFT_110026 [Auricularia subglabra TFB-10046 SS5]|nr:hypothetical protein AURDEDRAFT_110026 [Auricularia subglabra TFB-10046 SS5]